MKVMAASWKQLDALQDFSLRLLFTLMAQRRLNHGRVSLEKRQSPLVLNTVRNVLNWTAPLESHPWLFGTQFSSYNQVTKPRSEGIRNATSN